MGLPAERHTVKDHEPVAALMTDAKDSPFASGSPKAAPKTLRGKLDKGLDEGFTRLGLWGEVAVVMLLVLAILYLFAFSHGNSRFKQQLHWQAQGWPQPRPDARNWVQQHSLYSEKAAADEVELAFYGDSVVELLRGTVHMEPDPRGHGIPEVFHQHFGQKYRAAAFGISGDATAQLMWRLQNGEAPPNLAALRAAVVLIGSNDLTYASFRGDAYIAAAANTTADRIVAIAQHLQAVAPAATVLLLGLLPRGDQTLMPSPAMLAQPSKFTATNKAVNAMLEEFVQTQSQVQFLDCGPSFLDKEGGDPSMLDMKLMPDALHPNAAGVDVLAQCMKRAIERACGHK